MRENLESKQVLNGVMALEFFFTDWPGRWLGQHKILIPDAEISFVLSYFGQSAV